MAWPASKTSSLCTAFSNSVFVFEIKNGNAFSLNRNSFKLACITSIICAKTVRHTYLAGYRIYQHRGYFKQHFLQGKPSDAFMDPKIYFNPNFFWTQNLF